MPVTLSDIQEARSRIQDSIKRTPLDFSRSTSERLKTQVYLKLENQQTTGSFKIRGSLNKMFSLSPAELKKGVVASSAGNHAQGVAYAAARVGAQAKVVMPETAPFVKRMATQGYGAEVVLHGRVYDEAYAHARELEKAHGYTFIHPYEDPKIIAGQGTCGLEIMEDLPDVDSIVIPIGGGGLISGIATVAKTLRPSVKIYGVVSSIAPGMMQLFDKKPLSIPSGLTIADGIAIKKPSPQMYEDYISKLVDDIVDMDDDEIAEGIVFLLERAKTVVEGCGGIVLAAAEKAGWDLGKKTCLVLSGGNIDMNLISKVIERGLSRHGRLMRISCIVPDRPGTLYRLTDIIAQSGANVMDVKHNRVGRDLHMSETAIEFLLETHSEEQGRKIQDAFREQGARIN